MDSIELIGLLGALLSSITFIPQVVRTWQIKSAGDLSMGMLLIVFTSTIVWLIYGFALNLLPVIIANGIIFLLSLILIYFKIKFKRNKQPRP
ncbi:MAG: MtN3 and saliva related transmembrane protein [Roseivirga sp.]|jgi:MtN3 and saliva related transmembrane protein